MATQNAVQPKAPVQIAKAEDPIIFTASEIKSGLWRAISCQKNGQDSSGGDILLGLFVLNGDAAKAVEVAEWVTAHAEQIKNTSAYTLVAAKPIMDEKGEHQELARKISVQVTGSEMKARATAILALHNTEKEPVVLFQNTRARQPRSKGTSALGLLD